MMKTAFIDLILRKGILGNQRVLLLLLATVFSGVLSAQNVGIGTTTPSEKLEVVGNLKIKDGDIRLDTGTINGLGILEGVDGLVLKSHPSSNSFFRAVPNGGFGIGVTMDFSSQYKLWVEGALRVQGGLSMGADDILNVDAVNVFGGRFFVGTDGKVGIGTSSPSEKLEVNGKVKSANFQMTNGAANGHVLQSDASGNATWVSLPTVTNSTWTISGADQFSAMSGNVGIGTNAPSEKLEVNGKVKSANFQMTNGAATGHVLRSDANGNAVWESPTALPNANWTTSGTDQFSAMSGNVGIGTNAPSEKLEVNGTTKTTNLQVTSGAANGHVLRSDANGNAVWESPTALPNANWTTSGTDQFSALSGNVGIGTSTPSQKLEVAGNIKNSGDLEVAGIGFFPSNICIGTTAPNERLHINGNIRLDNSHLLGINTLEGAADIHFRGKPGNPINMFLSGDTGNLGIGTSSPSQKLEVNGNLKVSSGEISLDNNHIKGLNTLQGTNGLFFRANPNNASLLEANPNGNFGIGLPFGSTPAEKLQIHGNIQLSNATNNPNIFGVNALRGTVNGLHLQGDANSNSDLFVHPNGRVGIGNVPDPTASLDVNGGILAREKLGVGAIYSDVALNARSEVSDALIFLAEGATGVNVLEVQNDAEVLVLGNFFVVNGSKNFLMDHPLDPANKTLRHSCIESNEVLNVYRGNVTLDAAGKATVLLPDYFEALNRDFSYQLTCVGGYAQVFVAQKIANSRFEIAGGTEGLEVSWQVTGVRNDPWMRDHPYQSVMEKTGDEKGRYYYPEGYGQPAEKHIGKMKEEAVWPAN